MSDIQELMAGDHRHCDEDFAQIEQAIAAADWTVTLRRLDDFFAAMERHLEVEEQRLFPAFEAATGSSMGPTRVMRMEHEQIRALFGEMRDAAAARDADGLRGQAETLLFMMQQHNLKEENVLYPMCDELLAPDSNSLCADLSAAVRRVA